MNATQLMNVHEFAEALGITRACVRRWILIRQIAVIKIGRLVKIPASEVDRIVASGLRRARPEIRGKANR